MDPPEFNFENPADILNSLSQEDFERISSIASQFMGGGEKSREEERENQSSFNFDPEMIFRLMSLFERLQNQQNDPRCNLISALKPLLSPKRRQKADTALEFMKILDLFSLGEIFGAE